MQNYRIICKGSIEGAEVVFEDTRESYANVGYFVAHQCEHVVLEISLKKLLTLVHYALTHDQEQLTTFESRLCTNTEVVLYDFNDSFLLFRTIFQSCEDWRKSCSCRLTDLCNSVLAKFEKHW